MADERKVQLGIGVDATPAKAGFDEIKAAGKDLATSLKAAGTEAAKGIDGIGAGGDAAAQKIDKATRSIIGSIQRATAAAEAGERGTAKYYAAIASQKGVDPAALKPYLDGLAAVEAKQRAAMQSMDGMGMSAKATAAAMRGVPAQFTDIITALQGGQRPMTVLMQQGGQLKDMFGGAGNAARALGGYVAGLINPFTVTAAAVGTLGFAWFEGAKEAQAYAKALTLTGNAAGTTTNALQTMAARVAAATGATQGATAEVMAALASTGKVAAGNMELIAAAAVRMERATGKAIGDTVAEFAELGREPVKASEKLNEQYNYLTASVYQQIKALEDQGKVTEAAALAQRAYADALTTRSAEIVQNLGAIETAWKILTDDAKKAWDAMLGVGRSDTLEEKLQAAKLALGRAKAGVLFGGNVDEKQAGVDAAQKAIDDERKITEQKTKQNALNAAKIAWSREEDKYLSKRAQMEREIDRIQQQGLAAQASELEIAQRIAVVRQKYAEKGKAAKVNNNGVEDFAVVQAKEYAELYKAGLKYVEGVDMQIAAGQKMSEGEKILAAAKAHLTEVQYKEVEALVAGGVAKQKQAEQDAALVEYRRQSAEAATSEANSLIKKAMAAEEENARIGLTAEQLGVLTAKRYDEQIALKRAEADRLRGIEGRAGEAYAIEQQIAALERLKSAEIARPKLEAQATAWKEFARDIESALTDSLMRSFESGESFGKTFAKTLQNTLKTMVLKFAVQMSVGGIMNAVGLGAYSTAAGGASMLGTAGNLVSTGSGLYQAYTGFTTGAGTGAWGAAGNWAGNTTIGSYFGGYGANTAATYGTTVGSQQTAMLAAQDAGLTGGSSALGTLGVAAAWMAAIYMAMEYINSKEGGVKVEGDSFARLNDQGLTRSNTWVDGSGWYALGANPQQITNPQYDQLGWQEAISAGVSPYMDKPGDVPVDDQIARMMAPWTDGVRKMLTDLGGSAVGLQFGLGFNSDPQGKAPDNVSAGVADAAGNVIYRSTHDVDRGTAGQALTLEMQRMMLAAVRAADVSKLYKDYLAEVDIAGLTQEQVTNLIVGLGQLKVVSADFKRVFGEELTGTVLKALGGIEGLSASVGGYVDAIYTDEEKRQLSIAAMRSQFGDLGVTMPTTVEGFRKLVEAQDLTTTAGQEMFAALMKIAPAFRSAADAIKDSLLSAVDTAMDSVDRAITAEKTRLQKAYDAQITQLDAAITARSARIDKLSTLSATLAGALAPDTSSVSLAQRRAAQANLISSAALAKAGGVLPADDALRSQIAIATAGGADLYGSRTAYLRDQAQMRAALTGLSDITDAQLSAEEAMLASLEDARKTADAAYKEQIGVLDAQLSLAKDQVAALKGIDTSVLSVRDAINKLNLALVKGGAQVFPTGPTVPGATAVVGPSPAAANTERLGVIADYLHKTYDGGTPAWLETVSAWAKANHVTQQDVADALGIPLADVEDTLRRAGVAGFASGGLHMGGLRIVGESGPELEATGAARIWSSTQLRDILSGGDAATELRAVLEEIKALRQNSDAALGAIAASTGKTSRLLDRVMPDGDALAVRAAV